MKIFEKEYCSEELCDLSRDIDEAFDERFNPVVNSIPKDQHNFHAGSFIVTVQWKDNENT